MVSEETGRGERDRRKESDGRKGYDGDRRGGIERNLILSQDNVEACRLVPEELSSGS